MSEWQTDIDREKRKRECSDGLSDSLWELLIETEDKLIQERKFNYVCILIIALLISMVVFLIG